MTFKTKNSPVSKRRLSALLSFVLCLGTLSGPGASMAQADSSLTQDNVKLSISGHFKMYANIVDQNGNARAVDILRDTDVTFAGETELKNGLNVGVLVNADGDVGDDFAVEDSFIFASGAWGRLSLGAEDGAAFLLQVAAPSADANIDGIETFVTPFNLEATDLAGTHLAEEVATFGLDYDNDLTAGFDKLTYLTPVYGGLQIGVSYTPDVANFDSASRSLNGNSPDHELDQFGDAWEVGAIFQHDLTPLIHMNLGLGYTRVNVEDDSSSTEIDAIQEWNIGTDFDFKNNAGRNIGLGAVYTQKSGGIDDRYDSRTFVLGADYMPDEAGPWAYGVSWLNNNQEESADRDITSNRYTLGLQYNLLEGVSLRGALSHLSADVPDAIGDDFEGTSLTIGTQILF